MFYRVTAVDFSGDESDAACPENASSSGNRAPPRAFELYQRCTQPFYDLDNGHVDVPSVERVA